MPPLAQIQMEESDVISFHNYGWPEEFEQKLKQLQQFHRPLICTEYMARGAGSLFDTVLPVAHKYRVGAINWGLVAGKSQTYLPWDSWQHPYVDRSRRSGSTMYSIRTERRTGNAKWRSSAI